MELDHCPRLTAARREELGVSSVGHKDRPIPHHGFYIGKARDWDGVARLGVDIGDLPET
jgi:hypothetical protein